MVKVKNNRRVFLMRQKKTVCEAKIEQFAPFGALKARKVLTLSWPEVKPSIRLAHQKKGDLILFPRIIFDYLLLLIIEGKGSCQLEAKKIELAPRLLLLVSPFCPHSFAVTDMTCNHVAIHFDWKPQFPPLKARETTRRPYRIRLPFAAKIPEEQILTSFDSVPGQIQQIADEWQKGTPTARMSAEALLFHVLATLIRRSEVPAIPIKQHAFTDQARINQAIRFMQEKLGQEMTPETIAQAAGLSSSHFSRLFRKWTGHSPMEHLTWLRIQRAKELLGDVHLSVKEVAVRCGFEDQYYFSRVFTRVDGLPPSHYREILLAQRTS